MYAKIFETIYDGSLRKDWKALVVFQQLLILADSEGYVDKTIDAIASRTTIPEEIVRHGIEFLSAPDEESRSKYEDGRRIVLINPERSWGWRIVNYAAYRDIRNKNDLRDYWRGQKQDYRETKRTEERIDKFKAELAKVFGRKSARWSYTEDCQLLEIIRREDCMEELAEVLALRAKNARYFPHSIDRLLSNWNAVLDRSRMSNAVNGDTTPPHVRLRIIEERLAEHPARPNSTVPRNRITPEQLAEYRSLKDKRAVLAKSITDQ